MALNPNARRQIKDIQVQAESLINGKPSMEDIESFDQYNEELKKYLINNLTEPELLERVRQIPHIKEESNSQAVAVGIFATALAWFAPGALTFFQQRQRIENSKDLIRDARAAYANIEFFTRNL